MPAAFLNNVDDPSGTKFWIEQTTALLLFKATHCNLGSLINLSDCPPANNSIRAAAGGRNATTIFQIMALFS